MIHDLLRVETKESGARAVVATRPLRLQDVCKYWRLPHRLEDVDPLLGEMDPRVVARRGRPRNAPEEGIVPPSGTVIRRSAGQRSWQREPSSHEYLERLIQSSGSRASQTEGRVARQLATEGFAAVNSQQSGAPESNVRQEEPADRGGLAVAGGAKGVVGGAVNRMRAWESLIFADSKIEELHVVFPGSTAKSKDAGKTPEMSVSHHSE